MKELAYLLLLSILPFYTYSQDLLGKLDLHEIFQADPDTANKNKQIEDLKHSYYVQVLPQLSSLQEKMQNLDPQDKYYDYKMNDLQDALMDYQRQIEAGAEELKYQLYFTNELRNDAYKEIFLKEKLSCLFIFENGEFLGDLYNTEAYTNTIFKKMDEEAEKIRTSLIAYYEQEQKMEFYSLINLDEEDENYEDNLLYEYMKYLAETQAKDYSQKLISITY
ncbi:MAG: hypothetical protein KDC82_01850 [Bacteroidetes bacterium]|nr:hypothetical protein [Bacteroidota bacterium]